MSDPIQLAEEHFAAGRNCAQAVLSAFAAQGGIAEETALRMVAPFGGGIARRGETCGAVSGALMAIGLLRGGADAASKDEAYRLAREFLRAFEEQHGSLLCRDLIGYDLSTPEGMQAARDANTSTRVCPAFVTSAAEIVSAIIQET